MSYHSILVVSDNEEIVAEFIKLLDSNPKLTEDRTFDFACFPKHAALVNKSIMGRTMQPLNIKEEYENVLKKYDLVFSAHCKQIFPGQLVSQVKCINLHPGYNPFNRGWYPQVFSILNGLTLGATLHEIDEKLDHGAIIDQEIVELKSDDTSLSAYKRVQQQEFKLLERSLESILAGTYKTTKPNEEGNLNLKSDFEALREIPLDEEVTFGEAIDRLRALTHPPFNNAYFIDPKTGDRIWLKLSLEREEKK